MFPYSRPDRSERRVGDLDRLRRALFRVTLATVCKPGIIEVRDYNHFVLFYLYFFDVLKNSFHVIEDLNQKKCVRSYVTEALSLLSQKFNSGV